MGANTYLTERERRILENAKVGIAGAGGLGSNVAMLLVRAGMKKLVIADFDVVNESNLNRQFFFRRQLGEKKIVALAENLRMIESDLDLSLHDVRLTPENADFVFAGCNVVVEAFDSAEAKAMLLHSLLPTGKPIVSATGLAGWGRSNDIRVRKVGAISSLSATRRAMCATVSRLLASALALPPRCRRIPLSPFCSVKTREAAGNWNGA